MATTTAQEAPPDLSPQDKFFRYFQHEVTSLQEEIERLPNVAVPERPDATEHCLAGISRLSDEVKDASVYLPAYDQRTYAEALKALSEVLQETRAQFQPKSRFTFKTLQKNHSAISLQDAAEMTSSEKNSIPQKAGDPSLVPSPALAPVVDGVGETEAPPPATDRAALGANVRKPSLSGYESVQIISRTDEHVGLPAAANSGSSSGSIMHLTRCVADLTTESGESFAGLALKNIEGSLVLCGKVSGPCHGTSINNSTLVLSSRQVRLHQCHNLSVYLHCSSRPIIEDCQNVRFAPLPPAFSDADIDAKENLWDKVDDFNWLKQAHSPNWTIIPEEERISEEVWALVKKKEGATDLKEILQKTIQQQ